MYNANKKDNNKWSQICVKKVDELVWTGYLFKINVDFFTIFGHIVCSEKCLNCVYVKINDNRKKNRKFIYLVVVANF